MKTKNKTKAKKLGTFQREVMGKLSVNEPTNPLNDLKGKASQYWGSYLRSLRSLESMGLISEAKGPKGGRAWTLTEKGVEHFYTHC